MKFLSRALKFYLLLFAAYCSATNHESTKIRSVEPSTVYMRHAKEVHFTIGNIQQNTQLSFTPGGAYIKSKISVDDEQIILRHEDTIWLISKNTIDLYKDGPMGLVYFKSLTLTNNIENIAIFGRKIITSYRKRLQLYQLDEKFNLTPNLEIHLTKNIRTVSLSSSHACLILENEQLLSVNFQSKTTIKSRLRDNNHPTKISTLNSDCLSVNNNNVIALWKSSKKILVKKSSYRATHTVHEMIIHDNHVLLANSNTGLTLLGAKENKLRWLGSYNKLGNITHIAYSNKQILVADDRGVLSLFDVSRMNKPLLVSDFHLHDNISHMTLSNNIAYALTQNTATSQYTLVQIDFSAKSTPTISTLGVNHGGSRRSFIKDNILYVADWFSGLHLYDISVPHALRLISSYHTPGSPKGVVVKNNIAFVADDDHGLQIIDVSDVQNPIFVSELPLPGLAYTMKLVGELLYVAAHRGGFHIVNVSDTKHPRLISTIDTPGKAWALEYLNNQLFVADDNSGLLIFDVSEPSSPKLINQFNPGGFAEDIVVKNNKAYIAFFDLGLLIVDIQDPLKLKLLSQLITPGNARGIEIQDNLLYLASWDAGVQIIDISRDKNPQIIGHYDTNGATWGVSVKGQLVYAMDWWGGVKIIDASNKQNPSLLSQYQTTGKINDIIIRDNFIYTAHGSRGLQIYDAKNSLNPVWATGLDFDGEARSISLNKNLALIAAGDGGLVIADISDPFQIKWISHLAIPTAADLIQSVDQTALVATLNGDLYVIDISKPKHPMINNRVTVNTQAIKAIGQTLYQLNNNSSLSVYSINALTNHSPVPQFTLNDNFHHLTLNKEAIFLASKTGKISRYNIKQDHPVFSTSLQLPEKIISIYLHKTNLYVTTRSNKLFVLNVENENINLQSIYPTTHGIERISISKNSIFFSGETTIASGNLLPKLNFIRKNDEFIAMIPANMPLGAYNVNILQLNGKLTTSHNAFRVIFPKLKSTFTMEDFKQKMKEKNFKGKNNTN